MEREIVLCGMKSIKEHCDKRTEQVNCGLQRADWMERESVV
jgi:hypothetical protein